MPRPFLGVGPRRVPGFGNDGLSSRIDLVLAEIVDRARRSEPVAKLFAQTPVLVSSAREAQTMLRKFIEGFPDIGHLRLDASRLGSSVRMRVAASVFQVMVGGDGKPLADVLHDERAPMDALHRRPETTCSNARQCIRSIRTQRKTGRGRTGHGTAPRAWERARRFMGTTVRPSFLTDRRDDMGGRPSETRRVGKEGAKGRGDDVMAAVRGKGIPASCGGGGMARRVEDVPRRRSALFCLPQ